MRRTLFRQLEAQLLPLLVNTRLYQCDLSLQHGNTTVLLHCMAVAYYSLKLATLLNIQCDRKSLIRGALLHDYFLYDWHDPDPSHRLHGLHHAATALRNASSDASLTEIERDIILHHMFPLNISPPRSKEAILVCLVDKGCGMYETFRRDAYHELREFLSDAIRSASK